MTDQYRTFSADRGDAGRRLDLVLRRRLAGVELATRTRIQRLIADGDVSVNGLVVRRAAARVPPEAVIVLGHPFSGAARLVTNASAGIVPAATPDLLYEDDHLLAVNKPAGVVAHRTHAHPAGTLLDGLEDYARAWPAGHRPSLLSRLDKLTSGVMLVAKTPAMHAALQRALGSSGVRGADAHKEYLAVVYGWVRSRGTISLPLRRDTIDRRRVVAAEDGAPSRTMYERLTTASPGGVRLSLVRCRLVTGRTHQIRVHLASSGWPIVGDPVYGEPRWRRSSDDRVRETLRGFSRQALHAWRIGFTHPSTRAAVTIQAPVPPDLDALIKLIKNP